MRPLRTTLSNLHFPLSLLRFFDFFFFFLDPYVGNGMSAAVNVVVVLAGFIRLLLTVVGTEVLGLVLSGEGLLAVMFRSMLGDL